MNTNDIKRRHNTRQASGFLIDRGYPTAPATLNKLRCVGGGPTFELFGRIPLYTEEALLDWVAAKTSGPRRTTSSSDADRNPTTSTAA
jgi:hypothetical protein